MHLNVNHNTNGLKESLVINVFRNAFKTYYPPLCFFANKLVQDHATAEDIVEDVFLKLWTKNPDFSSYKSIKAVLYIAVRNACLDHIRKHRRLTQNNSNLKYLLQQESESFALKEIIRSEIIQEVYAELQKLPPECRKVMQYLFIEGWDTNKIAAHLNIGVGTVKTHKRRGINALRRKFGIANTIVLSFILLHS